MSSTTDQESNEAPIPENIQRELLTWANDDPDIKKLIQKKHIPGRVEQAIKFANFIEAFDKNPQAKIKFGTKENFYKALRSKFTNKREDTGFSTSSCKRLKTEGDCYTQLQNANVTKFPQSQKLAMVLKNCSHPDNIAGIWQEALSLYDGDETSVNWQDIRVAVKNYAEKHRPAPTIDETPKLKQIVATLRSQLKGMQLEITVAKTRAVNAEKQLEEEKAARDLAEVRLDEANPLSIVENNMKKIELSEECIKKIEEMLCLAYGRKSTGDPDHPSTRPFEPVKDYAMLEKILKKNEQNTKANQPIEFDVFLNSFDKEGTRVQKNVVDWSQWKNNVWRHLCVLLQDIAKAVEEKKSAFKELTQDETDHDDGGGE